MVFRNAQNDLTPVSNTDKMKQTRMFSRLRSFRAASVYEYAKVGRFELGSWVNPASCDIPAVSDRLSILRELAYFEGVSPDILTDGGTLRAAAASRVAPPLPFVFLFPLGAGRRLAASSSSIVDSNRTPPFSSTHSVSKLYVVQSYSITEDTIRIVNMRVH